MRQERFETFFFSSLLLHAAILVIFVASFEWNARHFVLENSNDASEIVNAVMINPSKIEMPTPALPPQAEIKKIIPPVPAPKPPVKPVPEKRIEPEKKIITPPPVAKKIIAIPTKPKLKPVHKEVFEKQLLQDLAKEVKRKKPNKIKSTDLEKEFAEELKSQKAKLIAAAFLNEKNQIGNAQSKKMQGIVDKFKALILQAISQHWLVPPGANRKLSSELLIRVAPGGVVLDVQLVKSSGDTALDQSARSAVFKASPLPVPKKSDEFEPFRQFILKVKPENIIAKDNDLKAPAP